MKNFDLSTINQAELKKLPIANLKTDRASDHHGCGCAGDPPGFPTYFLRSVYSESGNDARSGINQVIADDAGRLRVVDRNNWRAGETWETHSAKHDALMRRLWLPLPIDHPRTVAWIHSTFSHHAHCYHTAGWNGKDWNDKAHQMIWPGGCLGDTPFGKLKDLEFELDWKRKRESFDKWRKEEQDAFIAEIKSNNDRVTRLCSEQATPDNHNATRIVRRYYPEFVPTTALIESPQRTGSWWERFAVCPAPENCPGEEFHPHPVNGQWCQVCNWHA